MRLDVLSWAPGRRGSVWSRRSVWSNVCSGVWSAWHLSAGDDCIKKKKLKHIARLASYVAVCNMVQLTGYVNTSRIAVSTIQEGDVEISYMALPV